MGILFLGVHLSAPVNCHTTQANSQEKDGTGEGDGAWGIGLDLQHQVVVIEVGVEVALTIILRPVFIGREAEIITFSQTLQAIQVPMSLAVTIQSVLGIKNTIYGIALQTPDNCGRKSNWGV
jgi:hypothetical protein